ncbi:unnamed protein product [Closterium sp. NIES-54]
MLDKSTPRRESLQPNLTYAAIARSEPSGQDIWFLDSCCGQHMCSSNLFVQREQHLNREVVTTVANNQNLHTQRQGVFQLQSRKTNVILQMSKVLIAEGVGYNLLSVSQLMAKGIHLEADSTTQEFKLYNERGGLYIGNAVLKNNVFVLDFVPDQGTADSDAIVYFTTCDSIDNSSSNNISSSRDNNSSSNIGRSRSNNNSTSTNRQLFINTNSCSTPQKC